jgi:hypothetical protein
VGEIFIPAVSERADLRHIRNTNGIIANPGRRRAHTEKKIVIQKKIESESRVW